MKAKPVEPTDEEVCDAVVERLLADLMPARAGATASFALAFDIDEVRDKIREAFERGVLTALEMTTRRSGG